MSRFFFFLFLFLNHFAAVFAAWNCSTVLAEGDEEADMTRHKGEKGSSHFNVQPEWNPNRKQCMTKSKLDL
jgi:hypothetical protein